MSSRLYLTGNQLNTFIQDIQADTTTAGTALDFAWNDAQCNFTAGTSAIGLLDIQTTAGTNTWFSFDGTKDQLRQRIVTWTTTANITTGDLQLQPLDKKKSALMEIFKKVPDNIIKEMSEYEKKLVKAKEKSEKLLKDILSPKEYFGLVTKGEIEIPSKEEDIIFIVKKNPEEMIEVKKNGKYDHKLCIVASDPDMPVGDKLLSKILMVKTDEKQLRKVANRYS